MAKMLPGELESRPDDELLTPEELLSISIFEGVKPTNLERFPGVVRLRRYKAGETVCKQGAAGWTAFYILTSEDFLAMREKQGRLSAEQLEPLRKRVAQLGASADRSLRAKARVFLTLPSRPSKQREAHGLLTRTVNRFFGVHPPESQASLASIPIDGPVDLDFRSPVDKMYEGELFGEMSCINRYPRSATVTAMEDCYILEMLRNILELLQRNKAFKLRMDEVYRERVLKTHLRMLPIFGKLPDDALANLSARVQLVEKEPGDVIFKEGDPADSLYVIRIGTVKVTQRTTGEDRVLAYRGRGEYIGEIGLVQEQPRSATCSALDHPVFDGAKKRRSGRVELIRIAKDDLMALFDKFPNLWEDVKRKAAKRLEEDAQPGFGRPTPSGRFDELGLWQGQKLMLIDLDRCTRCDECVRACAATHTDGRARLFREGPQFERYLVPASCRQCLDPVCMIGCPVGSIHKGRAGEIIIEDWCIGCEICAKQCPYDAIGIHTLEKPIDIGPETKEVTQQAVVCDQCSSLGGVPSCVYACPHDAALRVDARAFLAKQLGNEEADLSH